MVRRRDPIKSKFKPDPDRRRDSIKSKFKPPKPKRPRPKLPGPKGPLKPSRPSRPGDRKNFKGEPAPRRKFGEKAPPMIGRPAPRRKFGQKNKMIPARRKK